MLAASWTPNRLLLTAFLLRLALVLYARIHDHLFRVKFTDIDYQVFSDAANLTWEGKSPFEKPTYRYTPLIAWLLLPNVLFPDFGKLLFCAVDILSGWLLLSITGPSKQATGSSSSSTGTHNSTVAVSALWLFNPVVAIISTRGSADCLVCASTLLALHLLMQGSWLSAAIIHGLLAISLKLYPVIYLPSIFMHLAMVGDYPGKEAGSLRNLVVRCLKNPRGFLYVMVSLLFFFNTVAIGYHIYGRRCVEESLLYHFGRSDIRHNFSPYFLPLYLAMDDQGLTNLISKLAFLPQVLLIAIFAIKYYEDLPFCWFVTTYAFVSFNKVSTSQYFVWYICLMPLICDGRVKICNTKALCLAALWMLGQAQWLLPAYLLEFQGLNVYLWVWIASLVFLFFNIFILHSLISAYQPENAKIKIQ